MGNTPKKSSRTTIFGKSDMISLGKERELVEFITAASTRGLWKKNPEELTDEEKQILIDADSACHKLVEGYSPLIEKIAQEHYRNVPHHRSSLEDFISESYIVALQCARTFDPSKGKTVIRFSSYFPRAVSSALSRTAMRSRSLVSIPIQRMTDARKWSHTKFDMENQGITPSDSDISEISGVDSTQQEVMSVLGATSESDIDDIVPPSVEDQLTTPVEDDYTQVVAAITKSCSPDYALGLLYLMGLKTGQALLTRFLLAVEITAEAGDGYDVDKFLNNYQGYINHPVLRMRLAHHINNSEG